MSCLQLPCCWSPARPSFFLSFARLAPPGLAGRKQQGFQAIFHACNGAEPLFCQKVFYVFIVFLAVQLPFFGTSDQLQMTSLVPDRRARAGGGRNGSCPIEPWRFHTLSMLIQPRSWRKCYFLCIFLSPSLTLFLSPVPPQGAPGAAGMSVIGPRGPPVSAFSLYF